MKPTFQTKPQQAPPEIKPETGQEEYIREQPIKYDPNERKPSETPVLPGEGPNNPEEPNNIPIPDPDPSREERVNYRLAA